MTKETKHLLYWWTEWLLRFMRTTWHIVNRLAYRKWKNSQGFRGSWDHVDTLEESDLH